MKGKERVRYLIEAAVQRWLPQQVTVSFYGDIHVAYGRMLHTITQEVVYREMIQPVPNQDSEWRLSVAGEDICEEIAARFMRFVQEEGK